MNFLSNPIHSQIHSVQAASLFDVDAIDAIEGIDDHLAAIGDDGIAQTLGDDLNRHAGLDADAVHALAILGGYLIEGHKVKDFIDILGQRYFLKINKRKICGIKIYVKFQIVRISYKLTK